MLKFFPYTKTVTKKDPATFRKQVISLIPVFGKFFEKLIFNRLIDFFVINIVSIKISLDLDQNVAL